MLSPLLADFASNSSPLLNAYGSAVLSVTSATRASAAAGSAAPGTGSGGATSASQPPAATPAPANGRRPRPVLVFGAVVVLAQLEVPLSTATQAARLARASRAMFILNAAPSQPLSASFLADVDVLIVNEGEADLTARAAGLDAPVEFDDQRIAVGQADLAVDQRIAAQFGDQVDILGAQRDIGAEDFQQVLVDLANRLGRLDVGGKTFLVVLAEIQGDVAPAHRAVVVAQGLVERAGDVQVVDLFQSMLDQVAIAAGGGDDPELIGVVGVLARCGADQALGRDADEAGQLGDDAFGKGMQALFGNELVAGGNDLLQPLAAFIQALQLVVGANGRGQRGVQPGVGQFAFCLVVVDVVAGDGVGFWRLARLAGAQDDADVEQHQVLADGLHRLEAGIVAFHDHIEQDHGDVVLAFEHGDGLAPRVGMDQLQATAKDLDAGQRELGGFVDIAVVIDDQDAPAVIRSRFIVGAVIFFDKEEIVVSVLRHGILKLGLGNFLSLI